MHMVRDYKQTLMGAVGVVGMAEKLCFQPAKTVSLWR